MAARILVVNDEQDILETFQFILTEEGYEVVIHPYLITNMSEVQHINPDLIILDLMFHRQNLGWNLLQKLKMYPGTTKIPVILCTAASNEVNEQIEYLHSKQIPVLLKPFDLEELLSAVRQQLTTHLPELLTKVAQQEDATAPTQLHKRDEKEA